MALNTIDFKKLDLQKGDKLLDMGCGLGRHSLLAFRDYSVEVFGVDLGFDDLFDAKQRAEDLKTPEYYGDIYFAQTNGYFLPFASNSFDKVLCSEVLEHVPDYAALIRELIRVLKPGGNLALSVPKYLPEKLCWLFSEDYPELAGHVRIFNGDQLTHSVFENGLSLIDSHSAHAIHSPYWWIRSLFFKSGGDFFLAKQYQKFMNWHQFSGPDWVRNIEDFLNPVFGKSNVYYFSKPNMK